MGLACMYLELFDLLSIHLQDRPLLSFSGTTPSLDMLFPLMLVDSCLSNVQRVHHYYHLRLQSLIASTSCFEGREFCETRSSATAREISPIYPADRSSKLNIRGTWLIPTQIGPRAALRL